MTSYLISEASQLLEVEAHVLRFWEDELKLIIPRNDLGHRYYTEVEMETFRTVKRLKKEGYQLKAIKEFLIKEGNGVGKNSDKKKAIKALSNSGLNNGIGEIVKAEIPGASPVKELKPEEKMQQFKQIMTDIMTEALIRNNEALSKDLSSGIGKELSRGASKEIGDRLVKELDFQMRAREEKEEERFRKLDEKLRGYHVGNKFQNEAAASAESSKKKKSLFSWFRKDNKKF